MMFELKGNVAIVTGPSGGIGKACAVALAKNGVNIYGVDYADLTPTKKELESYGIRFEGMNADLTKPSADLAKQIVDNCVKEFGHVDFLINNAGISLREDSIDMPEEKWDAVININLKNCFLLAQACARQFIKQKTGGKIVNMASMLAFTGGVRAIPYCASKHGIVGITKTMTNEWSKYGINTNAIAPGYINTPLNAAHKANPEYAALLDARIPCGRWGEPEEIANGVLFLCTKEADYIHGVTIPIDGGFLSW